MMNDCGFLCFDNSAVSIIVPSGRNIGRTKIIFPNTIVSIVLTGNGINIAIDFIVSVESDVSVITDLL